MDNNTSYIENITDLCRNLKLGGMKAAEGKKALK